MKTKYIILCMSAGLLMASCSSNEELTSEGSTPLKVSAGMAAEGTQTRVANSGTASTWQVGDAIGVSGNGGYNIKYTANTAAASSDFTAATSGIVTDTKSRTYTAYYPYDGTEGTDNTTAKDITVDNTTDYLYATGATNTSASVSFNFTHQLAKFTVKVTSDGTTALSGATWQIANGLCGGTIVPSTGVVTKADHVSVLSTEKSTGESVLLPAQTISSGLLHVNDEGHTYALDLSKMNIPLTAGNNTTLTLTLKNTTLTASGCSIGAWTEAGNDVSGNIVWNPGLGGSNGHEYEILDTADGIKWSTTNVGAELPADYGDYYAWGATSAYTGNTDVWSESNPSGYYNNVSEATLPATHDIATILWGGKWKMPTKAQLETLMNYGSKTWTTQKNSKGEDVNGYLIKSTSSTSTGKSIFLPAAGYRTNSDHYDAGSFGFYWSSTALNNDDISANYLYFSSGSCGWGYYGRFYGSRVRPVTE